MKFIKLSTFFLSVIMLTSTVGFAKKRNKKEKEDGFKFTTIKENPITSIKDQNRSSTCWCFSGLSLIESEILRKSNKTVDLSEMFIVSKALSDKAEKYLRMYGHLNYGPGSSFGDVLAVIKADGIVPEVTMQGLNYGEDQHVHGELDAVTAAYVKALVRKPLKGKLSTAWKDGFEGILAAYLGERPEEFEFEGVKYTPETYWESLDINIDDYVSLSSFTHHPFYEEFVIEVPDNWRGDIGYNLPLDELMEVMNNAIMTGYTFAWASDVSEKGFTRNGIAVVPDVNISEMSGSDQAKWLGLDEKEKNVELYKLDKPSYEKIITQELRQAEFDNQLTTDDHGMLIYGIAKDQKGTKYFMVKNSWGISGKYDGIWYASETFVKYKTMNIVLHKDAIPENIKKKLDIK